MEAIIERCCGMDVHRDSIVACLLTGKADEKPKKQRRTFGTMSRDLREMTEWLCEHECTHVAMESTGVYWMAPYKALEEHMQIVVGNAQHLSKVPGRKTDVLDSEWIAELLRHGLIPKSFIPPSSIRELRDLTRYRRKLVQSRTGERNRLQKLLETANIKLASVMSDVFGVSGTDMLWALVEGKLEPQEIAKLGRGQLRKKKNLLTLALDAPFEEHHRYLLRTQLVRLDQLDHDIDEFETRIAEKLVPYGEEHTRLKQIPGVSDVVASVIIAEMGVDMSVFPSAEDCASWAGLCPGNNESAGKRKSGRTRRGNPYLKPMLVEAAQAASRKKGSYLRDKFQRLRARRGYKRAVVAIAHKILVAAYHMLRTGEDYRELGEAYLDARDEQRLTKRLVDRLEGLGYQVTLRERDMVTSNEKSPNEQASANELSVAVGAGEDEFPARDHVEPDATVSDAEQERPVAPCVSELAGQDTSREGDVTPPGTPPVKVQSVPREARSGSSSLENSIGDGAAEAVTSSSPEPAKAESGEPARSSEEPVAVSVEHMNEADTAARPTSRQPTRRLRHARCKRRPRKVKPRDPRLPPVGTTLTRVFKDVEYRVNVVADGFEYDGEVYSSVSRVAKVITGTSYSGYVFFDLTQPWTTQEEGI